LQNWFCLSATNAENVLLHNPSALDLTTEQCLVPTQTPQNQRAGDAYVRAFPSPASGLTNIEFESTGTYLYIALFDALGHLVKVLVDSVLPQGVHTIQYDVAHLPQGTYFLRYQNNLLVQTKNVVVVR
jgi:Secretion system C-terminal sorting domain